MNNRNSSRIPVSLLILLAVSTIIRTLLAAKFELGNDEVYYWTYAVYPDFSHFDHPPMVGWLIRIFTLNLHFQEEFFVRLASVIGGTLNTFLIYRIGRDLKDELTGWYAALLFTASLYGFVITGVFILPDTPQLFFWLLALGLMLKTLPSGDPGKDNNRRMIWIGILLGLGLISKYTTAFLWMGMILYILIYNRSWLRNRMFYLANLVVVAIFSVVITWNVQNHFVSFSYQGGRGLVNELLLNFNTFFTELGGELLYHNPVNFILLLSAFASLVFFARKPKEEGVRILLLTGIPIILAFLVLALFRSTLPHWSGPGFISLIPFTALWIRGNDESKSRLFPVPVLGALLLSMTLLMIGVLQIQTGFISMKKLSENYPGLGHKDFSLELYGWETLGKEFKLLSERYEKNGSIQPGSPIISYRWFPAANLEYYVARPAGKYVLAAGSLDAIHKYAWINQVHGGFRLNTDAWYITSSLDFRSPADLEGVYFPEHLPPDTIHIMRGRQKAYEFYVYRMKDLQSKPGDLLMKIR